MLQTIEVEIDVNGHLRSLEPQVRVPAGRALLTLLNPETEENALLAAAALAQDWLKLQEDRAWEHLQPGK